MDLLSKNTLWVQADARLVVASGAQSFVHGGYGKTRFQGDSQGNFNAQLVPAEVDVVWEPRFSSSLNANVSGAWQRDHGDHFDLIEAFVNYVPEQSGPVGFSARAGLMWPEISLEHATGGAWSVNDTITPSAINSWVGEEVKMVAIEPTLHIAVADHAFSITGAAFGYNDTSGTLLSFRGWALQDIKATATTDFQLPPLDRFLTFLQAHQTQSTDEIDHKIGWYARVAWNPPWPFGVAAFYYDNLGDPQKFQPDFQWAWRTRFWNVGVNADLTPTTKLLAQAMAGSTIMGFKTHDVAWVHTDFQSAYLLVSQKLTDRLALTGRVETFGTQEHGSEMPPGSGEHGWAVTLAARFKVMRNLTLFAEALNVESDRDNRVSLGDLASPFESQTVFQIALRYRI